MINHKRAVPALPRGAAHSAPSRRPQASHRDTDALMIPMRPNDRWSLDFVSDQLTDSRRFRILAIVDDCTRESRRWRRTHRFRGSG